MLALRSPITPLSNATLAELAGLQQNVDGQPNYAARVDGAKTSWASAKKDKAPFLEVKRVLDEMCWGNRRCNYCEDSVADEIEHFRPKDLYPERAFVWENYLYACGPCNGPKNNHFEVFTTPPGAGRTDVTRRRNDPVVAPPVGDDILLNPRVDDPTRYLALDLGGTFTFSPRTTLANQWERDRAAHTIELLRLNTRPFLVKGRRTTFTFLLAALQKAAAIAAVNGDVSALRDAIQNTPHRCVWAEMLVLEHHRTTLEPLLAAIPAAKTW